MLTQLGPGKSSESPEGEEWSDEMLESSAKDPRVAGITVHRQSIALGKSRPPRCLQFPINCGFFLKTSQPFTQMTPHSLHPALLWLSQGGRRNVVQMGGHYGNWKKAVL